MATPPTVKQRHHIPRFPAVPLRTIPWSGWQSEVMFPLLLCPPSTCHAGWHRRLLGERTNSDLVEKNGHSAIILRSRAISTVGTPISTVGTPIFTGVFQIGSPPIPSPVAPGQSSTASASTGTRRAGRFTSGRSEFPRAGTTTESRHGDRSPTSLRGDRGKVHKRSTHQLRPPEVAR